MALERIEPRQFKLNERDARFDWAATPSYPPPSVEAPRNRRWLRALGLTVAGAAASVALVFGFLWSIHEEQQPPIRLQRSAVTLKDATLPAARVGVPVTSLAMMQTTEPKLVQAPAAPPPATTPPAPKDTLHGSVRGTEPSPFGRWIAPPRD